MAIIVNMNVSVAEAKNKLTQLLTAVERGERVTICRHGNPVADLVPANSSERPKPKFGTLRGIVDMTQEQFEEATRPMTDQEVEDFMAGRY
jgi:prevent-host-death family protein